MENCGQIHSLEVVGRSTGFLGDAGQQSRQIETPNCLSSGLNLFQPQFGFGVFLQTLPSNLTLQLWGKMFDHC